MTYGQEGHGGSLAQQNRSSSSAGGAAGGGPREQYARWRSSAVRRMRPQRLQVGGIGCAGSVIAGAHAVRGDVPLLYHSRAGHWRQKAGGRSLSPAATWYVMFIVGSFFALQGEKRTHYKLKPVCLRKFGYNRRQKAGTICNRVPTPKGYPANLQSQAIKRGSFWCR